MMVIIIIIPRISNDDSMYLFISSISICTSFV